MASDASTSRVYFAGNPYPSGHGIAKFEWTARLDSDGLFFDFHLESEDYGADDEDEDDEDEDDSDEDDSDEDDSEEDSSYREYDSTRDWKAKIVWGNYHKCTLSSTYWGDNSGIRLDGEEKLHLEGLQGLTLRANTLPPNYDPEDVEEDDDGDEYGMEGPPAFHVYLLGHDSVADHAITFTEKFGFAEYAINWTGKIALSYFGEYDYRYDFKIQIARAKLQYIKVPEDCDETKARELLAQAIVEGTQPDKFEWTELDGKRGFSVCG